ncbi:ATP-binding protein [Robiginitalea sp. SC105]|uniref:tetratricopeptide repeat-containing sensor histidine kinase n=1 Tax=Robiginitalea sp. SC105 TaxID=2762332 RepID=UPI002107616F|nr:ATP-binding protein [Robiginitalea sp. SC105]
MQHVTLLPTTFLLLFCCLLPIADAAGAEENPRKELRSEISAMERSAGFTAKDTAYISKILTLAGEMRFYDADSLLKLSERSLTLSEAAGFLKGKAKSYLRLADYHSDKGDSEKAIELYEKGLALSEAGNFGDLRLSALNGLSGEYVYKGDIAGALTKYLEALELAEQTGELEMQSILNENIANLYAEQKDYDHCLEYFQRVKRINDKLGNDIIKAETMSNLASVYADMGNLEYAMFNINQSIDIFEENRIFDWLAYAYETKGKVYLKKFNYKWALYWYSQAEMLHMNLEDDRSRIDLLNGMAEAHFGQGNDSLASDYATQAFRISEKIRFTEGKRDCAQTLYRIHRKQEDYATALVYHEVFQKLSDSISKRENQQGLSLLKTRNEFEKQKEELIEENEKALAEQKRFVWIGWVALFIALIIIYLVYRSKRLQKQLAEELTTKKDILEVRKAELQANNQTKTKLFSIIGHDLRGPIGALQSLLTMYSEGDMKKEEFLSFIPKLKSDVDHIFFTLNNLLSWGYTQMEGAKTKPSNTILENIVQENINLLAEIADQKSIRVVSELQGNTEVWSDPNQIDIVIRNLISNALKFTPENGIVSIRAEDKDTHWVIAVRDTGVGIDRVTMSRLFQDSSNTSTYGTNNEKGTGLGLSLCKEMVEKNNGKIWVDSTLRIGSTFYFTLPKAAQKYSEAV